MIIELVILWVVLGFLSFGLLGMNFLIMRRAAKHPWRLEINRDYAPKVSILVPTYNESDVIGFKLENLSKLDYPKELTQIIVVDSSSTDRTLDIVSDFCKQYHEVSIEILRGEKRGKSTALNSALKHCVGDVVVVSDADCFWPSNILHVALPFLADSSVGAVSGPKILLNPNQSWITRTEEGYLNSMNLMKFGESKIWSTLLFEGGFSAYKKQTLETFDPYNTGSDDCGTLIKFAEKNFRTIVVPEARFYTTFPTTWMEKISMKMRRSNQLMRVLLRYIDLILKGQIGSPKRIIIQGFLTYILAPLMFIALLVTTIMLLSLFPYFALLLLIFLIPRAGLLVFESIQNYAILFVSFLAVISGKRFLIWNQPKDRALINGKVLQEHGLI